MRTRPTSGPWSVTKREDGAGADIAGPGYTDRIAYVGHSKVEWEANARLIAAAPDLLAALRDYLRDHGARVTDHGLRVLPSTRCNCRLCEATRAALAKAEGSSS